jgi:1-deoxy-D-xylulose-5-phosphate synthase
MSQRYKSVVVLEDGIKHGGIASSISEMFRESELDIPIHSIGVPLEFIEHSKRAEIMSDLGITAQNIARRIVEWNSIHSSSNLADSAMAEMQYQGRESADRKPLG